MPTAAIVTFIAGGLFTFYLAWLELAKETKSWGKILILLLFFCVFLGAGLYDILYKDSKDEENHREVINSTISQRNKLMAVIDSTRESIFDSLGIGNNKISTKLDSIKNGVQLPVIEPTLILNNSNPHITYDGSDTVLHFGVKSINAESYIKSYRFLIFLGSSGEESIISKRPEIFEGSYSSAASIIEDNTAKDFMLFINRLPFRATYWVIVIQMRYSNAKMKRRPTFQRMVAIDNWKVVLMKDAEVKVINDLLVNYKY